MNAELIARALGGHRAGNTYMACCPAHEDTTPSLAIRDAEDGKVLFRCHAGCSQGSVLAALRTRGLRTGIESPTAALGLVTTIAGRGDTDRSRSALALWSTARPAAGSIVATYLASRGLLGVPPATLRFHPRLLHPAGGRWPAMVALVTRGRDDRPVAVHRTYIATDGSGKAPVDPPRLMLGPCSGGAVRLGSGPGPVMIGEGIETCLAAMLATGLPAWAALSTSGLRSLRLPDELIDIIVLADADAAGEAAAVAAARRWKAEGRRVRIARPPTGKDFNDALIGAVIDHEVAR